MEKSFAGADWRRPDRNKQAELHKLEKEIVALDSAILGQRSVSNSTTELLVRYKEMLLGQLRELSQSRCDALLEKLHSSERRLPPSRLYGSRFHFWRVSSIFGSVRSIEEIYPPSRLKAMAAELSEAHATSDKIIIEAKKRLGEE